MRGTKVSVFNSQILSDRIGEAYEKILNNCSRNIIYSYVNGINGMGCTDEFSSAYVDSNTYTPVVTGTKQTGTANTALYITNLYKADGSASSYKRVYAKATSSGTPVSAQLGMWYSLSLPSASQAAGSKIILYLMGNDPALDCRASGYWDIY